MLRTLFVVLCLSFPSTALACAVCFSGEDANRIAYIVTTGFLTFFPLLMVGFAIWVIRRHILRKAAELEALNSVDVGSTH